MTLIMSFIALALKLEIFKHLIWIFCRFVNFSYKIYSFLIIVILNIEDNGVFFDKIHERHDHKYVNPDWE